jgi:hypothetical protein
MDEVKEISVEQENLEIGSVDDAVGHALMKGCSSSGPTSISGRNNRKRKTSSWVHDYFSHDQEPGKLVCVQCISDFPEKRPYSFSMSSGTSTLNRHLEVTHKITRTGPAPIDPKQTTLRADGNLDIHNQINDDRKGEILKSLVEFIVDDKQAFSVVENDSFRKFVYSLNRFYKLPSRRTIVRAIDDVYKDTIV